MAEHADGRWHEKSMEQKSAWHGGGLVQINPRLIEECATFGRVERLVNPIKGGQSKDTVESRKRMPTYE